MGVFGLEVNEVYDMYFLKWKNFGMYLVILECNYYVCQGYGGENCCQDVEDEYDCEVVYGVGVEEEQDYCCDGYGVV